MIYNYYYYYYIYALVYRKGFVDYISTVSTALNYACT